MKPKESVPMFKPFEILKNQSKLLQEKNLLHEINKRLDILELTHSVLDTPERSDWRKFITVLTQENQDDQISTVRQKSRERLVHHPIIRNQLDQVFLFNQDQ